MTAFLLRARPFLMFIPWLGAVCAWSAFNSPFGWSGGFALVLAGLFAWTFIEWVVHRAMHLRVHSAAITRFQDEAHLRHHREPHDVEHAVVMLRASIPLAAVFLGLSLVVFRNLPAALLFHAGMIAGYLAYEAVHLATHARWRIAALRSLTRYHNLHHFRGWNRTFGVTTPLWDWVFGTLPENAAARSIRVSPGHRRRTGR
jgi:sterol desaturase/sphingolipid hydroxylase (fatty acid hydroxylase superfamily)